jgi:hypothetical protein
MDPIEVRDWTRGEIAETHRMLTDAHTVIIVIPSGTTVRLSTWQLELLKASLEIAGDL